MKEPKIRFKEFKGEWEETTFGESVIINSGLDYKHLSDGDIPVYGTGGYMLSVNQSLSEVDAIGIGRKGTIDKPQFLKAPFWTVDTLFFMTPKKGLDLHFLFALSQKTNWRKFDESTGVPSLSKINICKIDIFTPKISEQQSIASFFSTIDAQISAATSRLASLKQIKAASLQAMFPQEGETVPKLRFKGFEGEWEKVKLGDFGHVAMCKRIFKEQTTSSGDVPFFKIGTFGKAPDAYISYDLYYEYKSKYPFPNKSDILISAAGTIGRTVEYNGEDAYFQDSNIVWLKHNEEIENCFLKQLYPILNWYSLEGATIMRLYNNNILETRVCIPTIAEQKMIGDYFTNLDRQITLQSQRLEKLKQIKAACLDKMFV